MSPRPPTLRWAHLVLLSLLTLAKGAVWIAFLPAFLIADEPSHFDNVQFRAEHRAAPAQDDSGRRLSTTLPNDAAPEVRRLWAETLGKNYYRTPQQDRTLPARLEAYAQLASERDTKGQTTSMNYPGVYYRLAVPFYLAFQTSSVVTRITAVRVLSLLFGLCAVLATYLAARLVTDEAALAFAAAILVALQPMESQMTAAVNNDAGVIGFAALLFYFQLRALATLPAFPSPGTLAGLLGSAILLLYTKPTGYGALPGVGVVALAIAITHWQDRRVRWATGLSLVVVMLGGVYALSRGSSPLPGDTDVPGPHGHPDFWSFLMALDASYWEYLLRSAWGQFGWLDYSLQGRWIPLLRSVYSLIEAGTVAAAAVYSLRAIDRPFWFRGPLWFFSIGATLVGIAFILYVEHRFRLTGVIGVIQGRNFLFALPVFAIWTVIALGALVPSRMRGLMAAGIATGALCLNLAGLLTIMRQHYVH